MDDIPLILRYMLLNYELYLGRIAVRRINKYFFRFNEIHYNKNIKFDR